MKQVGVIFPPHIAMVLNVQRGFASRRRGVRPDLVSVHEIRPRRCSHGQRALRAPFQRYSGASQPSRLLRREFREVRILLVVLWDRHRECVHGRTTPGTDGSWTCGGGAGIKTCVELLRVFESGEGITADPWMIQLRFTTWFTCYYTSHILKRIIGMSYRFAILNSRRDRSWQNHLMQ